MPARERESIRFVLIPFSAPPFRHPGYLSLAHNPGGSRAAPTVVVSFHSPRSRLSPRSPPRGATSAPRLASLRKQSRTPGRPPAFTTTSATFGFQLWLELPRRHLTPPFHDTVERFPRLFSPRLLPRPVPLFSHLRILHPLGRAATAFQITPRSPVSFLFVLPFSSSVVLPLFSAILLSEMAYASVHLPPPPPPADLCHLLFFIFLIRQYALYARLRRMRECGEQTR